MALEKYGENRQDESCEKWKFIKRKVRMEYLKERKEKSSSYDLNKNCL